jgi:hypothetical protein
MGITFEEYLEFIDSDEHIDIYIYLGFFLVFVSIFIYKKIRQR